MSNGDFDIGATLRNRLQEILAKKNAIGTKIEVWKQKLQILFSKSKPVRMTESQLDSKIDDLERQRTLTSLPLAEEKKILREIDQIKKTKIQISVNKAHEIAIQEKKGEIENMRNEMRSYTAQIAELEAAIAKIDLAKRLGCSTQELKTHAVKCPKEKIGEVIGKGGLNIKQLEKKTGCIIDVDKVGLSVHLRGNENAIQKGIQEIENITLSVQEEIHLLPEVHSYLFGNGMAPLKELRSNNTDVYVDLSKDSKVMKIRGKVEYIEDVKNAIAALNVITETITLDRQEAGFIIGKSGTTIKSLTVKFNVGIEVKDVNEDTALVSIVGFAVNVSGAVEEVNKMTYQNKDIDSKMVVSNLVRSKLLENSGSIVKNIQKDVNKSIGSNAIRLMFEKNSSESSSISLLEIRSPRMYHTKAVEYTKSQIAEYESMALIINIESYMVPKFIGKRGEKIKQLRKLGKGATIEVDAFVGEISVLASDEATKVLIKDTIEDFVCDNQIVKIPIDDESMMGMIFGSPGKGVRSKILQMNVSMQQAELDSIALQGSVENITEAAAVVRTFIASNFTIEINFDASDGNLLQRKDSILNKIQKELEVKTYLSRSRGVIEIRGLEDNAKKAAVLVNRFLVGGDGLSVLKFYIPESVIGATIGKGGSNITKFEKNFEGVKVDVNSTRPVITIRGEEKSASACREAVIKEIAKFMVSLNIDVDERVHNFLSNASNLRKIINGLSVSVNLSNTHAKLRGNCIDVEIVKAGIDEVKSGIYQGVLSLAPTLFEKLTSDETQELMHRIGHETESTTEIDNKHFCFKFSAKASNVRRAKLLFLDYIGLHFPHYFSKVKIGKPFAKMAGESKAVLEMSADSGCDISFDHDLQMFLVQAKSPEILTKGLESVEDRLTKCKELIFVVSSEFWVLGSLLTTYRNSVAAIETSHKSKIDIFKSDNVITMLGADDFGRDALLALIDKVLKGNAFMNLPESSMPQFIGQSLKHMNSFAAAHCVKIDRVKKFPSRIRIQGEEIAVINAVNAVDEWTRKWETKNPGTTMHVDKRILVHLIDSKTKNKIAHDCGVKLDIYYSKSSVIIRGGKGDSHKKALQEMKTWLETQAEEDIEFEDEEEEEEEAKDSIVHPKDPLNSIPQPQDNTTDHNSELLPNAVPVLVVEKKLPCDLKPYGKQTVAKMFNFLISEDATPPDDSTPFTSNDPWDASTISGSVENVEEGFFRSTSGFTIRL